MHGRFKTVWIYNFATFQRESVPKTTMLVIYFLSKPTTTQAANKRYAKLLKQ